MLLLRKVWQRNFRPIVTVFWELLRDGLQFLNVATRSRTAVAAEVLFLRKQLAYWAFWFRREPLASTGPSS